MVTKVKLFVMCTSSIYNEGLLSVTMTAFWPTGGDLANGGFFLQHPFRKPKRIRTAFSPTQLLRLEQAFEKNHYVVGAERKQLAASLNLTETQVRFCNTKRLVHISRLFRTEAETYTPRDRVHIELI